MVDIFLQMVMDLTTKHVEKMVLANPGCAYSQDAW